MQQSRVVSVGRASLAVVASAILGLNVGVALAGANGNYLAAGLSALAMLMVVASVWRKAPRARPDVVNNDAA